jgi:hypothetical protein
MVEVQSQLEQFHNLIKPGFHEGEAILREKRDNLKARLKRELPKVASSLQRTGILGLKGQGSYLMRTTVEGVEEEIDIDVGLYLDVSRHARGPTTVKQWVYDALGGGSKNSHTHRIEFHRYCIRVYYRAGFHVDIAVYAAGSSNGGESYLATGKRHSEKRLKSWERSEPRKLKSLIEDRYDEEGRRQLRRIVRYLKRWSELRFSPGGNERPTGIALTAAAYKLFEPAYSGVFSNGEPKDLVALRRFVRQLVETFDGDRIELPYPAAPHDDLFGRMTTRQQRIFKDKLQSLLCTLKRAEHTDPAEAHELLASEFGEAFRTALQKANFQERPAINEAERRDWSSADVGKGLAVAGVAVAIGAAIIPPLSQKIDAYLTDLKEEIRARQDEIIQGIKQAAIIVLVAAAGAYFLSSLFSD